MHNYNHGIISLGQNKTRLMQVKSSNLRLKYRLFYSPPLPPPANVGCLEIHRLHKCIDIVWGPKRTTAGATLVGWGKGRKRRQNWNNERSEFMVVFNLLFQIRSRAFIFMTVPKNYSLIVGLTIGI